MEIWVAELYSSFCISTVESRSDFTRSLLRRCSRSQNQKCSTPQAIQSNCTPETSSGSPGPMPSSGVQEQDCRRPMPCVFRGNFCVSNRPAMQGKRTTSWNETVRSATPRRSHRRQALARRNGFRRRQNYFRLSFPMKLQPSKSGYLQMALSCLS